MDIIKHPIKPQKEKTWHYKSHPYFTKQASNVVSEYINNYTIQGDTVLDPYCGTGVTAIEALSLRRKVIVFDINPLACFITEQNCLTIDLDKLYKQFRILEEKVKPTIDNYFKMSDKAIDKIELKYWYPKKIKMPLNADFKFVEELFTKRQLLSFSLILHKINKIKDNKIKSAFLFVFSASLAKANRTYMPSEKNGKQVGGGGSSIFGTYRYWKPKDLREIHVWENFVQRFKFYASGKEIWNNVVKGFDVKENLKVINDSVLNIKKYIEPDSIDYIYTDPPYGGNIAYLDLSTMWNAWLGFKVTKQNKEDEIIEGGDLGKSQENYEQLFSKSFEVMSKVLKKNGWMSLVFAHKKLEFWNTIIDSCESNGLEFIGSIYQPTNNSSIHYKKNPANVLCSQRIANFQKTFKYSKVEKSDDVANYILNEIERSCLETRGAPIDKIYQKVLDKLLDNKMIYEAKKKGYLKLDKFLDDKNLFNYEPDSGLYYVKDPNRAEKYEKEFFKHKDEVKIYIQSMLKKNRAMTVDLIHKELFELFSADKKFPIAEKDIADILKEVAHHHSKTGKWVLNSSEQIGLGFGEVLKNKLVRIDSEGLTHSEVIYRLHIIGNYLGFKSFIGDKERASESYKNVKFSSISEQNLIMKEFEKMDKAESNKIKQIDLLWLDKLNNPRYAFEVEESTSIISAFDRFTNILKADHTLSNHLFVVLPRKRERAFNDRLKTSNSIGHPIYLDRKMKYIFKEELKKFYDEHIDKDFDEFEFKRIFSDINIE